jgi:chromosome segregation ATPase
MSTSSTKTEEEVSPDLGPASAAVAVAQDVRSFFAKLTEQPALSNPSNLGSVFGGLFKGKPASSGTSTGAKPPPPPPPAVKLKMFGGQTNAQIIEISGMPEKSTGILKWYKADAFGALTAIDGFHGRKYYPSIEDISKKIAVQWIPDNGSAPSPFCESSSISLDAQVENLALDLLHSGASIEVTEFQCDEGSYSWKEATLKIEDQPESVVRFSQKESLSVKRESSSHAENMMTEQTVAIPGEIELDEGSFVSTEENAEFQTHKKVEESLVTEGAVSHSLEFSVEIRASLVIDCPFTASSDHVVHLEDSSAVPPFSAIFRCRNHIEREALAWALRLIRNKFAVSEDSKSPKKMEEKADVPKEAEQVVFEDVLVVKIEPKSPIAHQISHEELAAELFNANKRIETLISHNESLMSTFSLLKSDKLSAVNELSLLSVSKEQLAKELTDLKEEHERVSKENDSNLVKARDLEVKLEKAVRSFNSSEKEVEKLKDALKSEKENTKSKIAAALEERSSARADTDTLKSTLQKMSEDLAALSKSKADLEKSLESERMRSHNLVDELKKLKDDSNRLQFEIEDLKEQRELLNSTKKELSRLSEEMKTKVQEKEESLQRVLAENARLSEINLVNSELASKFSTVKTDRDRIKTELDRLESIAHAKSLEIESLRSSRDSFKSQIEELELQIIKYKEDIKAFGGFERRLSSAESVSSSAELAKVRAELNAVTDLYLASKESLQKAETSLRQCEEKLRRRDSELQETVQSKDTVIAERNSLKKKVQSLTRDMEKWVRPSAESLSFESELKSPGRVLEEIEMLKSENIELQKSMLMYRSAFERQISLRSGSEEKKLVEMQNLSRILAESVAEKDEQIRMLKSTCSMLQEKLSSSRIK